MNTTTNQTSLLTVEAQVIGAVLSNESLFARAAFLEEDAFSDDANASIWKLICQTKKEGGRITPATIAMNHPGKIDPLGGLSFLNRLSEIGGGITTAFGEAVDRLHEELQWKRITNIATRLQSASLSRDQKPEQILSSLVTIATKNLSKGYSGFRSKRDVARDAILSAKEPRETLTTGINSLDFLMQGGLQSRRLYGIGGLYGRGKTVLLGSISDNINIQGASHLFLSLETPPEDIEIRSCAKHLNLNASSILDPNDPDHGVFLQSTEEYIDALPDNAIYEFAPGATIDEIHRKILAAKSRNGIKGVIIDYWQLIRGRDRSQSEESHLRDVADRLAAICRQEDIWIVLTAQIDERGRLKVCEALLQSAALYVRLVREEDERVSYFVTEKSNYTRYGDTGSENVPGMIFDDQVGPHFRNTDAIDAADISGESEGDISL
jgi:replicative DNA helicase